MASQSTPSVHINPRLKELSVSATVAINDRSNELRAKGKKIFKLGLGESPFPVPRPVVESLRQAAPEKSYLPVKGLPQLCRAVADHHIRSFNIHRNHEDVMIGPGSKELMFLLQLVYYGDLIIPSPSWVSYAPQATIIGREIHWINTRYENNWLVQADELEKLCFNDPDKPRLMILNYPSNPTGQTYTETQLQDIADVARKHRVLLLSDEIYAKLNHHGEHRSIVELYPEGTIFSGGLSKWCGAGGWRLGVFVFPEELRWLQDAMAVAGSETFTSTSAPIQHAAIAAFRKNHEIDRYVLYERKILKALGAALSEALTSAGARVKPPMGAFYLFPDFSDFRKAFYARNIRSSREMCEQLLDDTGVAVLPGSDFGRPDDEFTARLAYVDFDGAAALEGMEIPGDDGEPDADFLRTYCGDMLEAVARIGTWLEPMK